MKNKERIEQLEKQVQVLLNRVALLEMKLSFNNSPPPAPAPMPTTWPTYPTWKPSTDKYVLCNNPANLIQ